MYDCRRMSHVSGSFTFLEISGLEKVLQKQRQEFLPTRGFRYMLVIINDIMYDIMGIHSYVVAT